MRSSTRISPRRLPAGILTGGVSGAGSVNGSFTWNSGTLTPDVSFNVPTNGLLLLASVGTKILNGTITNAGLVRWTGLGNLRIQGAIHNLPGSLFDIQNNELLDYTAGSPVVINDGTFRKSAGIGATAFTRVLFTNAGTVEVRDGTLDSRDGLTQTAGETRLAGGSLSGGTLNFTGRPLTGFPQSTNTGTNRRRRPRKSGPPSASSNWR